MILIKNQETKKTRIIPDREFYPTQSLGKIEPQDIFVEVSTLSHHDVYNIDFFSFLKKNIYPLSYCIPDECIVSDDVLNDKTNFIADLIPGNPSTYRFGADDEVEYNKMYQSCLFAHTQKKGGWDCLRHYEIMANGCLPIFKYLENCPQSTLTTMPKQLIQDANRDLLPWNYNNKTLYDSYVKKLLQHVRENCSASATTKYFLDKMGGSPKNVLLIMGNIGVNYTRETFWIGMKRHIQNIGGVAVEYPKIDFLYNNYSGNKIDFTNAHSCGGRLEQELNKFAGVSKATSKPGATDWCGREGCDSTKRTWRDQWEIEGRFTFNCPECHPNEIKKNVKTLSLLIDRSKI